MKWTPALSLDINETPFFRSMLFGFFLKNYESLTIAVIVAFLTWIYAVKKSSGNAPSTAPAGITPA